MLKHRFRHWLVAIVVTFSMVGQVTWVLAGTTGTLGGTVNEESAGSPPIAGAKVSASSPSQAATTTTDANGHFVFLSLAPDSYTVSVEKAGFEPIALSGVNVLADQAGSVAMRLKRNLQTIGRVTSRASSAIVRPGTTSDVYSVNQTAAAAVQSLGGGGNLNNYYSAVASVPGVTLGYGGVGWGQTLYVHGSNYAQIGYELDGIPVNRAFDNYQATTASNLGQQELQVVTSSVAGASSSSVAGYINQVIRTGTYPGFANVDLSIGSPAFYHAAKFEIGGSSPNRNFSYYLATSGYNQDYRYFDQYNGGSYPNGLQPSYVLLPFQQGAFAGFGGVFPNCVNGVSPYNLSPGQPGYIHPGTGGPTGCMPFGVPYNLGTSTYIQDRENVANIHIGIPHHHDGGKDDIQILYNGSALWTQFADSINDTGGLTQANQLLGNIPQVNGIGTAPIHWGDTNTLASNIPFLAPASQAHAVPYLFPGSPQNRAFNAPYDPSTRDGQQNDAQIVKLQYQHNINASSYIRAYGYTFYSDWFLNGPTFTALQASMVPSGQGYGAIVEPAPPDYELDTHTRGGEISYANQLNSQNLLQASVGYVTASVIRLNNGTPNTSFTTGDSGLSTFVTNLTDGKNCYRVFGGAPNTCFSGTTEGTIGQPTPICGSSSSTTSFQCPVGQPVPITGAAAAAGATYRVTYNGFNGTYNTVTPQFSSASITDQWKPNDKLLLNGGIRFENYNYVIPTGTSNGADYQFWFNQAAQSYCYDPANNAPVTQPGVFLFGAPPLVRTAPGTACPLSLLTGKPTLHPNGQNGAALYTNQVPGTFSRSLLMPRINGTYTFSPDTVVRFGAGIYSEPYNTATTEYLNLSAKSAATFDFQTFWPFGFNTPQHEYDPSRSYNLDASLEQHLKGTDMSFKLTPFYRYVHNQYQDFFIGAGFVSSIPTGDETAYGTEFQFQKGDPTRDGFSGSLSYTYTHAFMKFNPLANGSTPVTGLNSAIDAYNALTKQGNVFGVKGAPCYFGGQPTNAQGFFQPSSSGSGPPPPPVQVCNPGGGPSGQPTLTPAGSHFTSTSSSGGVTQVVVNQYYNLPAQGDSNTTGPYPVYQTFPSQTGDAGFPDTNMTIVWPHVFAGWLNYKHDRLTVTPNFQMIYGYSGGSGGGAQYGSPLAITGLDPRTCTANQLSVPTAPNKGLPNYTSCFFSQASSFGSLYIPDPYTGKFDTPGQYQSPWFFNLNANIAYDITNKAKVVLVLSNLFNTCFGGSSTPWSSASPPGYSACGYLPNDIYTSNYFNGSSARDVKANGVLPQSQQLYPYQPATTFLPFSAALQFQFKI